MRKLVFLTGLPRSGTTLLANLLVQNPEVYATASSGLMDTLRAIRDVCDSNPFYKAMDRDECNARKRDLLCGAVHGYFAHAEGKVCFDKSRGWPTAFELMEWVLGGRGNVKAVVCVRDLRDVLASFEKRYRVTVQTSSTPQERKSFIDQRTALGRAQFIMKPDEPVGFAMDVVRDAVTRGWRDNMLLVDYDSLCHSPQGMLEVIYQFIGEKPFEHDPEHVEQVTREDDLVHSFVGLHDIRPEVKPQEPQWPLVYDGAMTETPFWARVTEGARFWEHMK